MKSNHVNPNCKDSRYCKPHGEMGPVEHDIEKFESQLIKKIEGKAVEWSKYNYPIVKSMWVSLDDVIKMIED